MTATTSPNPLKWSSQFSVLPAAETPVLKGDKIILPPSALEQLLTAATTIVTSKAGLAENDFDPYNPYSVAAERQARADIVERQQTLPHPLTFRLVNPENRRIVFAGIREFSSEAGLVGISPFLRDSLGFSDKSLEPANGSIGYGPESASNELSRLTVHVQELSKGTYVKLRPLEAGYDPEDWKALLERSLRDNFTTLTHGEILTVAAGREEYRFLVDELKPSHEAVSLVDTDLEVDIEALNEEQARETLKKRMQRTQHSPGTSTGRSTGGNIPIGQSTSGQVPVGEYVDYTVEEWDRTRGLEVELEADDPEYDLELFITPAGPKQRARPREEEYILSDVSTRSTKRIKIEHTNTSLENAEALWISVKGCLEDHPAAKLGKLLSYHLQAVPTSDAISSTRQPTTDSSTPPNSNDIRCKNCHQWVPKQTMMLHENFCLRNNILCPQCSQVFQKSSPSWQNHWHCPHDSAYGSTPSQHQNHDSHFHTPQTCKDCGHLAPNMRALAHHRTTTCPAKPILCQFCHLIVPQQGADDPAFSDAEVILSNLTPHELTDGARTTECHLCAKIVRLRDMSTHLRHHDLQRLSRPKPRLCQNVNCGRTLYRVSRSGDVAKQQSNNHLGICDTCFGPLYVSMYDPDGKALRRRVERKYLTQLLTGCGQGWCANEMCRTARRSIGLEGEGKMTSRDAMAMVRPLVEGLGAEAGNGLRAGSGLPVWFCADEGSQRRRGLAEMMAAEGGGGVGGGEKGKGKGKEGQGYELEWCVAALEVEGGDLDRARQWLRDYAPTRAESSR